MGKRIRKYITKARIVRGAIGLTDEQCAAEIAKINASYDFSEFYKNKDNYLPTDETGKIILDPNNPKHRKWMED